MKINKNHQDVFRYGCYLTAQESDESDRIEAQEMDHHLKAINDVAKSVLFLAIISPLFIAAGCYHFYMRHIRQATEQEENRAFDAMMHRLFAPPEDPD